MTNIYFQEVNVDSASVLSMLWLTKLTVEITERKGLGTYHF